jgi:GNAT superfamily N-acetyltransferase
MSSEKNYFTQKKFIEAIAVLSTAKKSGSWQLLMTKAEDWCREQHCTELVLDVFSANQKAISFHERKWL